MSLFLLKTTDVYPFLLIDVYIQHSRTVLVTKMSSTAHVLHHSRDTPGQAKTLTKPLDYLTSFSTARLRPQSKNSLTITLSFHKGWEKEIEEEIQHRFGGFIQQENRERLEMGVWELQFRADRNSCQELRKHIYIFWRFSYFPPLTEYNFFSC